MRESITLYELNALVRDVLDTSLEKDYWVQGELSEARVGYGGHFYGELIQKDEHSDKIIAKARVTCWANRYSMVALRFNHETGESLKAGIKVLIQVQVSFHEQYGYSLNILDIDSSFSLGNIMQRRREILRQLEKDGILHDNQELPVPRLLKRIAVISSATAAGYGDFCNQLEQNDYGFHFEVKLFPAVMQGEQVPESIIAALEAILADQTFDLVTIIRGGGASSDLSDFDSYKLAACIAQYPLPILTGIGHERDETVLDYVAHTKVKTPTAAAAFIIDHQAQEAAMLDELYLRITRSAEERIQREKQRIEHQKTVLPLLFINFIQGKQGRLELLRQRLSVASNQRIEREQHHVQLMEQRLNSLDPKLLLKRGYSITTCRGRIVRGIEGLEEGDVLTTNTGKGDIYSKVIICKKN